MAPRRDSSEDESGGSWLLQQIKELFRAGSYRFSLHATHQTIDRVITTVEIEEAVFSELAEVIEDYPDDPRGPSCLILGWTANGRPLHVQVSYPPLVVLITIYEPDDERWLYHRKRRMEDE